MQRSPWGIAVLLRSKDHHVRFGREVRGRKCPFVQRAAVIRKMPAAKIYVLISRVKDFNPVWVFPILVMQLIARRRTRSVPRRVGSQKFANDYLRRRRIGVELIAPAPAGQEIIRRRRHVGNPMTRAPGHLHRSSRRLATREEISRWIDA